MLTSDTAELFDAFGAFVDGSMVGESVLMGSTRDNLEVAQVLVWVDPRHQRHGYGARLLAHVEEHAAHSRGRRILRAQARVGEGLSRNRRFAERHGYDLAMTEIERRLQLPPDHELLDRLTADAAPYHRGYEIRSFVGPVPAELRATYVDLRNLLGVRRRMVTSSSSPGGTPWTTSAAIEREREEAGRTSVVAVAVHEGVVVAYADASVPGGRRRARRPVRHARPPRPSRPPAGDGRQVRPAAAAVRTLPGPRLRGHDQRRDQRPHGRDQPGTGLRRPPGVGEFEKRLEAVAAG
jgi:hypothetical protein